MAIKIHHGANGSYKTSGAVWDDAVPAAREGLKKVSKSGEIPSIT